MPKVSQEHLDARRAQILDGARRAFSRFGYDGATVARLEEETGLSRGAIFNYFGSKEDLFIELAVHDTRRYTRLLYEEGVDEAIRQIAAESPEWLGVMLEGEARLRHEPELERRLQSDPEEQQRILGWFESRQKAGIFRRDVDTVELARFAGLVVNGLALRVAGGDATNVEPMLTLLHDALAARE